MKIETTMAIFLVLMAGWIAGLPGYTTCAIATAALAGWTTYILLTGYYRKPMRSIDLIRMGACPNCCTRHPMVVNETNEHIDIRCEQCGSNIRVHASYRGNAKWIEPLNGTTIADNGHD